MLDTKISGLTNLGIYRDGGSISASFAGADGFEYCLFFGIRRPRENDAPAGYRSPLLQWFRSGEYRSPITGDVSPFEEEDSEPIPWSEARRILNELSQFFEDFSSDYRWVFGEMISAAAQDGR